MSHYRLGVTGGIGCGKTAATDIFKENGIAIVDADLIAREVVAPQTPALTQIREHFGGDVLLTDGSLNREYLRQKIFNEPTEKKWLEDLLHPIIREEILRQLDNAKSEYVILSAPLLLENNLDKIVDSVLVIDCNEEIQLQRTLKRDKSNESTIRNIISQQISRENRLKRADSVISNNDSLTELKKRVNNFHQQLLKKIHNEQA